jgi:DNA helicase HerA-like ATPase
LGILPGGSLHHLEAVVGFNNLFSHFVGRVRSWNKDHLLESEGLPNLFGSPKVTQVNGIEGTSEKPDPSLSSPCLDLLPPLTQLKSQIRISKSLPPPKRLRAGRRTNLDRESVHQEIRIQDIREPGHQAK